MDTLTGADHKIIRAFKHIKVSHRLASRFVTRESQPVTKENPESKGVLDLYANFPPLPAEISLVLGDAIHNIRAGLDHIVYELVLSNPARPEGTPNKDTMFPICDTKAGWERQVGKLCRLRGLPGPAFAVIEGMQPYQLRDTNRDYTLHPLWILNKLENIDKHRRLAVTATVAVGGHLDLFAGEVLQAEPHVWTHTTFEHGAKITSIPLPNGGKGNVKVKGNLSAVVAFQEPELPRLTEVYAIKMLAQIARFVGVKLFPMLRAAAKKNPV